MDRLYQIRRLSRQMTSYSTGKCHVCEQGNTKVRRLTCGRHNCCRVCVEFVPRLIKGDFTCKICSTRRPYGSAIRHTDDDKKARPEKEPCDDAVLLANVETEPSDVEEQPDNSDLEGNNTEWDYLLQSIDEKPKQKPEQTNGYRDDAENANEGSLGLIQRKRSYIKLVPPSTLFGSSSTHQADNQIARRPSGIRVVEPPRDRNTSDNSKTCHVNKLSCRGLFRPDPTELERGTSPCKGYRRTNSFDGDFSDFRSYIDPCVSDTEQLREQIGEIEGPAFTSSSASASGSEESLVFSPSSLSGGLQQFEEFWDRK